MTQIRSALKVAERLHRRCTVVCDTSRHFEWVRTWWSRITVCIWLVASFNYRVERFECMMRMWLWWRWWRHSKNESNQKITHYSTTTPAVWTSQGVRKQLFWNVAQSLPGPLDMKVAGKSCLIEHSKNSIVQGWYFFQNGRILKVGQLIIVGLSNMAQHDAFVLKKVYHDEHRPLGPPIGITKITVVHARYKVTSTIIADVIPIDFNHL